MSAEEEKIEQEIASNVKLPDINLLNKQVNFKIDRFNQNAMTKKYIKAFLYKLNAIQYFNDLIEIFNEIKYSHIMALCNYRFSIKLNPKLKDNYNWKLKYHFENSVYRYYSFWEITGRFLNSYFDLRLEFNKKNAIRRESFSLVEIFIPKYKQNIFTNI